MCSQLCLVVMLATALCIANASSSSTGSQLNSILSLLGRTKPMRSEAKVETDMATAMQRRMRCARWSRRRLTSNTHDFTFTCCIAHGRLCLNPNEQPPPPKQCNMVPRPRDSCNETIRWNLGYGHYDFQLCTEGQGPTRGTRCTIKPPLVRCNTTPRRPNMGGVGGDVVAQAQTGATHYGPCYCITDSNGKQLCDPRCG